MSGAFVAGLGVAAMCLAAPRVVAQHADSQCKPIRERTGDLGCWIIVDASVGRLPPSPMYWHLDAYPTRA
jgi:hypothetical protein